MDKQRTIFIGDIHGMYDCFCELLQKIEFNPEADDLICLGDVMARGPAPLDVLHKIMELKNCRMVKGNHEWKLEQWFRSQNRTVTKYPDYYDKLSDKDIEFILGLPCYIELSHTIAVHAGIKTQSLALSKQGPDLMFIRYTDLNRKFISLRAIAKHGIEKLGAHFWTEFGPFYSDRDVVYGHHVHSLTDIKTDTYQNGMRCFGIDTGCVFGGNLTALVKTNDKPIEIVQVKAKDVYCKPTF